MRIECCKSPKTERILEQVKEQFHLEVGRPEIHVTDLTQCLRKAYWDKIAPLPPSNEETSFFIRGLALQEVLLKGLPSETRTVEGIALSPDYFNGDIAELKTTLISRKRLDNQQFPEHWIKQLMAYCYGFQQDSALLVVLPLLARTTPLSYKFYFDEQELMDNWKWLSARRLMLEEALNNRSSPEGDNDWQCSSCRYQPRCMIANDIKG